MRTPTVIRQELADTKATLQKTTQEIAAKQEELASLRKETASMMLPHVTAGKVPSSIGVRRDKMAKLHTDLDLLTSVTDLAQEAIASLEQELASAEVAEREQAATMMLQGLVSSHHELGVALINLKVVIDDHLEMFIRPLSKRLREHSPESIVRAASPKIDAFWPEHQDFARNLLRTLNDLPALNFDMKPLQAALADASGIVQTGGQWLNMIRPQGFRFTPTPPPAPEQAPAWKPATVQEAQRLGLLWVCPETGRKIICSAEQLAALLENRRKEVEAHIDAQPATGELPQRT
jgi:hypothetical protein